MFHAERVQYWKLFDSRAPFLLKLHRAVERDSSSRALEEYRGNDFGAADDFLERFELDKWDSSEELQSMRRHMERMFDDCHNRFKLSPLLSCMKTPATFSRKPISKNRKIVSL